MMEFMRAGGLPIWVVLIFGLADLLVGVLFVFRPDERKAAVLRALSNATLFAILSGVAACLAAVMIKGPRTPDWAANPQLALMTGIGEALTPAILGFSLLALTWLLAGVGSRRNPQLG